MRENVLALFNFDTMCCNSKLVPRKAELAICTSSMFVIYKSIEQSGGWGKGICLTHIMECLST